MCGIVGIIGQEAVSDKIIDSLQRLEYRGYDSAGVATVANNNINLKKVAGKIKKLREAVNLDSINGAIGIGHTRWATHGAPCELNAHPMQVDNIVVVHNGIIENHQALRDELAEAGHQFQSETDTEVIPNLIKFYIDKGLSEIDSVRSALKRLDGAFALGILFANNDDLMIGTRRGAPLAVGIGLGEMYLGSDAFALSPFTDQIIYLEDDDIVSLSRDSYKVYDASHKEVKREIKTVANDEASAGKGDYPHFMLKEIYEQPGVISKVIEYYEDKKQEIDWKNVSKINIIACGTSYYAASVAKYWFEKFAGISVEIDIASEFRYRSIVFDPKSVAIFISQSGETADTLAAMKYVKDNGIKTVAIVNVVESSIGNMADYVLPICAGPEIGVASTKAFTAQLMVLAMQAGGKNLKEVAAKVNQVLQLSDHIKEIAHDISDASSMIYIGRATSYPIAMEGALKIKELSYIHAEGAAAGELKHGPIALIDEKLPIVVIAPYDELFAKTASNVQEIHARGGRIIIISDKKGIKELKDMAFHTIELPEVDEFTAPIIYSIPVQLLAYHTACALERDVDQPRNLAKSVTVE